MANQDSDPQREKDIQTVCTGVLNCYVSSDYNGTYTCPFCLVDGFGGSGLNSRSLEMSDLKHKADCIYHIAKDLTTK